ncbi:GTPase-activating Rap/Ran-GAP domain-like protein 3 [Montipora capricornis]|uniref:GTPase-activating Rap/Ran-GAP domain-like protein 3 n=1 Tax=Montipora capricornis TaxID=246305 RepID=UPI0035F1ABB0
MDPLKRKEIFVHERPTNSGVEEPRKYLPRPALQIKRYSSPPGTLQGFEQYIKEHPSDRVPSPDIARRSGLSRKHYYGSLEALNNIHLTGNDQSESTGSRFRMESGEIGIHQNGTVSRQGSGVHLENPEFQTRWYFKYFLGKVHQNFVGIDGSKNPFILSVCLTDADNYGAPQYRAILWRKTGSQKVCIPYQLNKPVSPKSVLQAYGINKVDKGPKEVLNPEIQKELLVLEEQEGSVNFKFGVLYARQGQTTDDEVFSNETVSEDFERFLELLGERIELKGWKKYRGGLDVKNDMTGSHSLYTVYEGHEVMFHVSTLLPFTPDNPQQVERKRHIGNDIAVIVFQDWDENSCASPPTIKSKFVHIYALVSYNKSDNTYRLTVFSEKKVPIFGPPLPCPPMFRNHQEFRDFLLVKLMNGEKAVYASPTFSNRRQRTLDSLIKRLLQDHMHEKLVAQKSWNDALNSSRGNRRKGMEREQAFLQLGQSLKLQTIVKGDAPTSLASTAGNSRFEPWEPLRFYENFPSKIFCGDSWGNSLVLGTEDGIQVIQGKKHRYIFDKSVVAKQMSVVEGFGLFLFRVDKGKEFHSPKLYVFRLTDFEDEDDEPKSRSFCKGHRVEKSKGCHLFALSQSSEKQLKLAVAVGRKVTLLRWKYDAVRSTWSMTNDKDVANGFEAIQEVAIAEAPILMTLVNTNARKSLVCVGYKHQFDLIDEDGEVSRIHTLDRQKKATLVSAVDVYEEEESELLISFNHQSIFKRLTGEQSSNFAFQWNSAPNSVVCAFPYLLAFTTNTIEIRLVVNANLVHTLVLPKVALISAKADIYFSASPPRTSKASSPVTGGSGPPSPSAAQERTSLYKISTISLMGQFLDPPLLRNSQLDVVAPCSASQAAGGELSSSGQVNDCPPERSGNFERNDFTSDESTPACTNTSFPELRKVAGSGDSRVPVKYSWTATV